LLDGGKRQGEIIELCILVEFMNIGGVLRGVGDTSLDTITC
jgi:hypothetical protein